MPHGWQKVKGKRTRAVVVGSNQQLTAMKDVPKTVELHASLIDPNTTPGDLKDLLRPHFPDCESPTSRHPDFV